MMQGQLRWVVLGMMVGLLAALAPACTKKCAPDNCTGCCTAKNECLSGAELGACGTGGVACTACGADQECSSGACAALVPDGGGEVDAGPPPCVLDDDCRSLGNGSVCDTRSGECVGGRGCFDDSQCQIDSDPNDPCYRYGIQCRCDLHDAPDAGSSGTFSGTCRRRLSPCSECTADTECGVGIVFGPPEGLGEGRCRQLQGDSTGKKYCLYQRVGACPCGTVDDGDGYCRPQSNSCSQVGCNMDKDCPSGSVCSVKNVPDAGASCGGLCVPRCRWDFVKRENSAPGCPPGQTCWVDSTNLDPASAYYGSGRCKQPCAGDPDCKEGPGNPFGGTNLKCAGELLMDGSRDKNRCRANGACMDDEECPQLPNTQPNLGYCERATLVCKTDCRTGNDPLTQLPFKDCRSPYSCAADGGVNICRLQTCMEQGGATIACPRGSYCCGDDKDQNGQVDPCPATGKDPAGCYPAPNPPFCTACTDDDSCRTKPLPSYLTGAGACPNGSLSPSCSPLAMKCITVPGSQNQDNKMCAPATFNDNAQTGLVRHSTLGCPSGWLPTELRPLVGGGGDDYCATDADCNQGTDAGRCDKDLSARLQDGGFRKACLCKAGSATSQCPNNTANKLYSECASGVANASTHCIESVVCELPPGVAFKDAGFPSYGCGLPQ